MDLARLHHVPGVALEHDGAPVVAVGVVDLAERGREDLRVGILLLHAADHLLEALDLGGDVLAAGLGTFDAQAELEVLLVADEDVRDGADLGEDVVQFLLAADPEGGAVVEVESDARAVLLRGAGDLQAELAGVGAQRGDQAGQVHDLHPFLPEDAVEVEIFHVEGASHFTGAVVPDTRSAGTVAAVGDVDLVTVAPGAALRHLGTLEVHPAAAQVGLDERGERAPLDEGRENLDRQAEVGGHAGDVGLGAGGLEVEDVAGLDRLAVFRGDAESHRSGDEEGVFAALFEGDVHIGQ